MASPERELISQREYARRRGISHVAVGRAVASGRITTIDGKIDPAVADREWAENTDQSKPRNSVTGEPRRTKAPDAPSAPMDLSGGDEGSGPSVAAGYARARAARELYQAQHAKLDLDRERGILVRADEVKVGAFTMARKSRDLLMALPERLSAVLAAESNAAEVQRLLEDEIERICQEISDAERP